MGFSLLEIRCLLEVDESINTERLKLLLLNRLEKIEALQASISSQKPKLKKFFPL